MSRKDLPSWLAQTEQRAAYLLKADSDDMERWRSTAAAQGYSSFAGFARAALDQATNESMALHGDESLDTGLVTISTVCYQGGHDTCVAPGCECSCHRRR